MSNRSHGGRSITPKITRYLHRIEQLIGNDRRKSPSPLTSHVKKSIKTQSLDSYLKYELTFKIIQAFFERHTFQYLRIFFNNLRHSQTQKVQKIYRFISIQKSSDSHLTVDLGIASKMLGNQLKAIFRIRIKNYFDIIFSPYCKTKFCESRLTYSKISNSPTPNFERNKGEIIEKGMMIYPLISVLKTIRRKNLSQGFKNISINYNQAVHSIYSSQNSEKQAINAYPKILLTILNNFFLRNKTYGFHFIYQFSLFSKKQSLVAQIEDEKIRKLASLKWSKEKQKIISNISLVREVKLIQSNKSNHEYSIHQITNKMSITILYIIYRYKSISMNLMKKYRNDIKCRQKELFYFVKALNNKKSELMKDFFWKMKFCYFYSKQVQKQGNSKNIHTLPAESVRVLLKYAERTSIIVRESFVFLKIRSNKKHKAKNACQNIFKWIENKIFHLKLTSWRLVLLNAEDKKQSSQKAKILFLIHKISIHQRADAFVKIKLFRRIRTKKRLINESWISEIENFLQERERFQDRIYEGWNRIQTYLKKQEDSYEGQSSFKIALSPREQKKNIIKIP